MTEEQAQDWLRDRFGVAAFGRLQQLNLMVAEENGRQNLVAPSTFEVMWNRHILDSAQLVPLAPSSGTWIDVGTGGGFPGLVVAILRNDPVILVEPRRKRADFLVRCVAELGLAGTTVHATRVEQVSDIAMTISARAVASIENILHAAAGCATMATRWLLPRGRFAEADRAQLKRHWRGVFHVEQSLSDAGSSILVLDGVSRR
ncbi:16S rRNA (guanine(527)-N(7))-methyltransferase RsmG [Sphingomonas sp.]|uniref:16S rRNA (guanine(527)-N(7))-methyltransferase RsmG n=1 Tax=Sphingomonas sp. TaxID=28214 RepID=UPI002D7E8DDD|nr:16S rRNA (guanine(527)-N(7))-methyltransferase RsmG [Sphingomonas sp.]HEU0045518.1 16S rRNA (guanine(527)-N(7))-methyltransferase RsmG [Sphingomonas sp.]